MKKLSDHLFKIISSERFLHKRGLGAETPFFICPYAQKDAPAMAAMISRLVAKLENNGVIAREVNLYDTCLKILGERDRLRRFLAMEEKTDKDRALSFLRSALDPEKDLVPAICADLDERDRLGGHRDAVFISGVAEVYPYARAHTLLTNMQSPLGDKPLVLFFPGEYSQSPEAGFTLRLFGRLKPVGYYRAFNILNYGLEE